MTTSHAARNSLRTPGLLLGVGLGGFVDGIVLHQILQWHHLLSSAGYPVDTVAGLEVNTLADGAFHAVAWMAVLTGLVLFHRRMAGRPGEGRTGRELTGWMLAGWGGFNLVEGLVNHHLLGVHHVRGGPYQLWWDLGFLALGAALVLVGLLVRRSPR